MKITKEFLDRARVVAKDAIPFRGSIKPNALDARIIKHNLEVDPNKCMCGLGLLLKTAGEDLQEHDTSSALVFFELMSRGMMPDEDDVDFSWSTFDLMVYNAARDLHPESVYTPLALIEENDVFERWLDKMEEMYVE